MAGEQGKDRIEEYLSSVLRCQFSVRGHQGLIDFAASCKGAFSSSNDRFFTGDLGPRTQDFGPSLFAFLVRISLDECRISIYHW
jgi:hypothetical protein